MADSGYPPCVNPAGCDYTLCFMERRDWDECPACGWEIPVSLRLNADMTGPREPEGDDDAWTDDSGPPTRSPCSA
jgi:hypothetical protein